MQILEWIFKPAQRQPSRDPCDQKKDIFHQSRPSKVASTKWRIRDFKAFAILCRKDIAKSCFYSTINLKQPATFKQWEASDTMKKEKEEMGGGVSHRRRSADHVGNKVLPLCSSGGEMGELKEKGKGEKEGKAMSRMKELLKWAAATRADKGGGKFLARKVLLFRNRPSLKPVPDSDEVSLESPKISFGWELDSCSTTTSFSDCAARKANWIMTDSEFVVLEL